MNKALCILRSKLFDKDVDDVKGKVIVLPNVGLLSSLKTYLLDRKKCEKSSKYLQLTPYVTLIDDDTRTVYCYKRSSTDLETRLAGKHSIAIGGHIEIEPMNKGDIFNILTEEIERHLYQEVSMVKCKTRFSKIRQFFSDNNFGLIYSNEDKVSFYHLCVSLFLPVKKEEIIVTNKGIVTEGYWMTPSELIESHNNGFIYLEPWSKTITYILNETM